MQTTTVGTLEALFVHNDWARDRVLESAATLADERLDRPFEMGLGSLRLTLHHLWAAERFWLDRWLGKGPADLEEPAPPPSIATLADRFRSTAQERNELLARVGEPGYGKRIDFTSTEGIDCSLPLGDMMLQVCDHGIHHRAQVVNMLRHLDVKPSGVDYLHLVMESPAPPAVAFDVATIDEYYRYTDWAHTQVLDLARALDDDALDQPVEMGVGSLRKTLLHMHDAERWWLDNWSGRPAEAFEQLPDTTSIAEIDDRVRETTRRRREMIATLGNDDLQRTVTARPSPDRHLEFALGDTMLQLCGHGTHHRAQAINMLRHRGVEAADLDYIIWFREHGDA